MSGEMTIRALALGDAGALAALQTRVRNGMANRDWFAETTREQFTYILSGGGCGLGVWEGENLSGAWVLYYPFDREDSLAAALGRARGSVAHFEVAMLEAGLRGRGLHGRMVAQLTAQAARDGRFACVAATVHPDNAASLNGFLRAGYRVEQRARLYGGLDRLILVKNLEEHSS